MINQLVMVALSVVGAAACAHAARIDVVILAGQSNMVGLASANELQPGVEAIDRQVGYYFDVSNVGGGFTDDSGQTFGLLQPWRYDAASRRFGPEITLGRDLAAVEGLNPAIIKAAVGGSDMARWQPGAVDFNRLQTNVSTGIAQLLDAGHSVRLLGMAWLQGESDALVTARADAYAVRLGEFISGFRAEMDVSFPGLGFLNLDVLLIEPANWKNGALSNLATAEDIAKVTHALMAFADTDPNSWFIPTDDFKIFEDNLIHFSVDDQLALGHRIAETIRHNVLAEPAAIGCLANLLGVCVIALRRTRMHIS